MWREMIRLLTRGIALPPTTGRYQAPWAAGLTASSELRTVIFQRVLVSNWLLPMAFEPPCTPILKELMSFPKCKREATRCESRTPREFKPYRHDEVVISGKTRLDDIVLERVTNSDALPPTAEMESQLSGAELMWNLPGTVERSLSSKRIVLPATVGNRYSRTAMTKMAGGSFLIG